MEELEEKKEEQTEEQEIAKMFLLELSEARELISAEGGDVGICPHCLDTGYSVINKDGYSGIEARIENEIVVYNQCFHGQTLDDDAFNF